MGNHHWFIWNRMLFCFVLILARYSSMKHNDKIYTTFCFRYPVVSGFYKLLEVCMKICNKLSFFKVLLWVMLISVFKIVGIMHFIHQCYDRCCTPLILECQVVRIVSYTEHLRFYLSAHLFFFIGLYCLWGK